MQTLRDPIRLAPAAIGCASRRRETELLPASYLGIAALAMAVMAGCYPKSAPPPGALSPTGATSAATRWPGATPESLAAGHDLFIAKCNGCHGYPDLGAIAEDRWPAIVERMGKKVNLEEKQRQSVLHYILAARSEHVTR